MYTRKKAASFNPYFSLGLQMLISSVITLAIVGATGTGVTISSIPVNSWWAIGYLVIIGSVLTFIAYIYTIKKFYKLGFIECMITASYHRPKHPFRNQFRNNSKPFSKQFETHFETIRRLYLCL